MNGKIAKTAALAAAALTLAACAGMLPPELATTAPTSPPQTTQATTAPPQTTRPPAEQDEPQMLEQMRELYARNPDTVGWIHVPGTLIDYPVVYCKDNLFYLDYDFDLNKNPDGAIFLSREGGLGESYRSLALFGNHRAGGQMFSDLHKYKELDFYRQSPTFSFDTLYEEGDYKIFSVFYMAGNASDGQFYYYPRSQFASDADYERHLEQLVSRSIFELPVDVTTDDKVVIMTCYTYETENLRIAVAGRKIRPGESANVDTDSAALNQNPLYPQKWYDKFGGRPPELR